MWRDECRSNGFSEARRTQQYCGSSGDASDVVGLPGIHQEVKFVEKLNLRDAMEQAKNDASKSAGDLIPIVAHKKSHKEWLVTMQSCSFFELYKGWLNGKKR